MVIFFSPLNSFSTAGSRAAWAAFSASRKESRL